MISLINRTHYSIQKAFSKPLELAKKAKELGYEWVAICDIGNVSAAVEFLEACKSVKIKPIIGCDFGSVKVFCKNLAGWKQLIGLLNEFSLHDRLERKTLASSDLISFTDELPDCRYIEEKDEEFYKILRALALKVKLADVTEPTSGYHMRPPIELPEYIKVMFQDVEVFDITGPPKLPKFSDDEVSLLWNKVRAGFDEHTRTFDPIKKHQYLARVNYEMRVIELANLSGYFLIVADFVAKARDDGQLCSVGRGSSSGCLVSDLIGINLVDPIPYGLLFSRFFNAARCYPKHLSFDEYPFIDEFRDFEADYLKQVESITNENTKNIQST
jgi:DNA polymerase III alpha subunit